MKKIYFIFLYLFSLASCDNPLQKSEFACFNEVDIKLSYNHLLEQEKQIKNHLDDYHEQFISYYENIFEQLDNQSNIIGLLGKVGSSIWNGKGLIGLESRHKSLPEEYNQKVMDLVNIEIKKMNIMIHYTYNDRIAYYRSTIPKEGEPLNTKNIHPRFFLFRFSYNDKEYNEWIENSYKALRNVETKLSIIRYRKAYHELYLNKECNLTPLVNELIAYIFSSKEDCKYEYELKKIGLHNFKKATEISKKFTQKMELWNEDKLLEFEHYKTSLFTNIEKEIKTLLVEVNMDSEYVDFIKELKQTK